MADWIAAHPAGCFDWTPNKQRCPLHREGPVPVHPPSEKVKNLAERLMGSCGFGNSQRDVALVDEINDLTAEECKSLDMIAFECTSCNWWFAAHERKTVNDEWRCTGCAED